MHKYAVFTRVGQRLPLAERKRRRVQLVEESAPLRGISTLADSSRPSAHGRESNAR